jgi:hypothetical protein
MNIYQYDLLKDLLDYAKQIVYEKDNGATSECLLKKIEYLKHLVQEYENYE